MVFKGFPRLSWPLAGAIFKPKLIELKEIRMFDFNNRKSMKKIELKNAAGIQFEFLENGSVFSMMHGDILINQVLSHPAEGAMNNIYLRVIQGEDVMAFPILGPESCSEFSFSENAVKWQGQNQDLVYTCCLQLDKSAAQWYWTVSVKNMSKITKNVDVIFTQDLGIAGIFGVRNNEAYSSQYIDHTVFKDEKFGYLICSRQNQMQGKGYPWIMHGCLDKAAGYLTDGFQFFGLSYKCTDQPEALQNRKLANFNYQYEFAFPTLQSQSLRLTGQKEASVTFFGLYEADHKLATQPKDAAKAKTVQAAYRRLSRPAEATFQPMRKVVSLFDRAPLFVSKDLSNPDLDRYFGKERRHVEKSHSFFCGRSTYVALRAKELSVERPHGQVLRSGREILPSDELLSTTAWMNGIFNSQVTIGNTNFNKLLSVSRNHLNVLKSSGQRIFVKTKEGWELLAMPSAFEIGLNSCRWIYKGLKSTIIVKVWTSLNDPACFLEISVEGSEKKEFLISNFLVLGNMELDSSGRVVIDNARQLVELTPAKDEFVAKRYPDTRFYMVSKDSQDIASITGDGPLFEDNRERNTPFVVIRTKLVNRFSLTLTGNVLSADKAQALADKYSQTIESLADVQKASDIFWDGLCKSSRLGLANKKEEGVSKLNDILFWYLQNAMVHFTIPHGLEQYSGAAWGLRDVCQGPVEFLYSTRNREALKDVLKIVFAHQFQGTGDWPQWFMFDRYQEVQSPDSHADIIIWPMKALCDYIELTNDFSILDEPVAYTDDKSKKFTSRKEAIANHVEKEIAKLERDCISGTSLMSYGHGDWEDTLQPADPAMRERLVSAWTVELVYQTLKRYQEVCRRANKSSLVQRLEDFTGKIRKDFNKYLVKDKVVAGLAYFGKSKVEYMLHPLDKKTGIKYRLIPMTRAMIAGIFTPQQAQTHFEIIQKSLKFPDGVRLMNQPIPYKGGVEKYFKRAETASNFGREIGLQYVHAHIRYIEAMAKIGNADEVYQGLLTINPITIAKQVPSALPRQSNAYFSSSDADFTDRYQALKSFSKIKKYQIGVKGGWRIYSSGPGIYLHQLVSGFLGLREMFDDVVLDPVMPKALSGMTFDFEYEGKKVCYQFTIKDQVYSPSRVLVNGREVGNLRYETNPYRQGGALINKKVFKDMLNQEKNKVEIIL
jgi:cellobiose phosphorylase